MIRRFETRDIDEVMSLWLHANIESHSFIEADYWKKNYDMVGKLIPEAEVFVAEENEELQGFIGLTDTYIAGIFVKATEQSKGIGTELLRTVMKRKDHLKLNVYKKNMRAVVFYQHCELQKVIRMFRNCYEKEQSHIPVADSDIGKTLETNLIPQV